MSTSVQQSSHHSVAAKVKAIVIDALHVENLADRVTQETYLENLGLDSLNIVDVLLGIEAEFGTVFNEDELDFAPLETVGTLSTFVLKTLQAKG